MHADSNQSRSSPEHFLAELTDAAYRVALRHGFKGSFLDVELDLWAALRSVLARDRHRPRPCQAETMGLELDEEKEAREPAFVEHQWFTPERASCTA